MNIQEAKELMTDDSISKLKDLVTIKSVVIDTSKKLNDDIVMQALCSAVNSGIILPDSLDEKTIKLLNSNTNTLSAKKLGNILTIVNQSQKPVHMVVTMIDPESSDTIREWIFTQHQSSYNNIFNDVINYFNITAQDVRHKLSNTLKSTIVNNVAQLVAKYQNISDAERASLNISITTVMRLVNMNKHLLYAEMRRGTS